MLLFPTLGAPTRTKRGTLHKERHEGQAREREESMKNEDPQVKRGQGRGTGQYRSGQGRTDIATAERRRISEEDKRGVKREERQRIEQREWEERRGEERRGGERRGGEERRGEVRRAEQSRAEQRRGPEIDGRKGTEFLDVLPQHLHMA
eukprot:765990-Hanusia_phi.AAC.3